MVMVRHHRNPRLDSEGNKTRDRVLIAIGVIGVLVLLAFFFRNYDKGKGIMSNMRQAPQTQGAPRMKVEGFNEQNRKRLFMSQSIQQKVSAIIDSYGGKVKSIRLHAYDYEEKGRLTEQSEPFVLALDVYFPTGYIIRTKAFRTRGKKIIGDIERWSGKAVDKHQRLLEQGRIDWNGRGRIIEL